MSSNNTIDTDKKITPTISNYTDINTHDNTLHLYSIKPSRK